MGGWKLLKVYLKEFINYVQSIVLKGIVIINYSLQAEEISFLILIMYLGTKIKFLIKNMKN